MERVGTLSIDDNEKESKLDGTLLAVQGSSNPLREATAFLENKGFGDGDQARVTGSAGRLGTVPVIFMTDAQQAELSVRIIARPGPGPRISLADAEKVKRGVSANRPGETASS